MVAHLDTGNRAEWLACGIRDERESVKTHLQYGVHFHTEEGEYDEMQPFGELVKTVNVLNVRKTGRWGEHVSNDAVCMHKMRNEEQS